MSIGKRLEIGVHFDLVCPWCYIGKRQFDAARERFARRFPTVEVVTTWHPVQLLPEVPEQGLPFAAFYQRRLGSPEAVQARQQQVALAALSAGLDLDLTTIERMPNTAKAHRLLRHVARMGDPALYEALLERLFAAYFDRGEDIGDAATLRSLAMGVGVPVERIVAATRDDAVPPRIDPAINGVPFFVFNGRLALSGANNAAMLLAAMYKATKVPDAAEVA